MIRRPALLIKFAAVAVVAVPLAVVGAGPHHVAAAPVSPTILLGDWSNVATSQTGSISHIRITRVGPRYTIHTYGACTSTSDTWFAGSYPCDLGDAALSVRTSNTVQARAIYSVSRVLAVVQTITTVTVNQFQVSLHVQSEIQGRGESAVRVDNLVSFRPSAAQEFGNMPNFMAENDGVIVPAGGACSQTTFLGTGVSFDPVTGNAHQAVARREIERSEASLTYVDVDLHLRDEDPSSTLFGNDNQLILLPGNRLLMVWAGWTAKNYWPTYTDSHFDTVRPSFWDSTTVTTMVPPDFTINGETPVDGYRGAYFLWESDDCGKTWYGNPSTQDPAPSVIDSGTAYVAGEQGGCGWAQAAGKKNPDGSYPEWHPGGWDRPEIYYDPYADKVWIATICASGTRTGYDHTIPYPGFNSSHTWIVLFSSPGGKPNGFGQHPIQMPTPFAPDYMTSTPDKRLFMFMCYGDTPDLYWLDAGATKLSGFSNLSYPSGSGFGPPGDPTCSTTNHRSKDPDYPQSDTVLPSGWSYNVPPYAISRAGSDDTSDMVRVAWPESLTVDNPTPGGPKLNRQIERVVLVSIGKKPTKPGGPDYAVNVAPITTIAPVASGEEFIFHAVFVQAADTGPDSNIAMMYWLESSNGQLCVKYTIMSGPTDYTIPRQLSTPCWTPVAGAWLGDYMRGSTYTEDGHLNFVGVWHEATAANSIHYNVVTMP